jgi:hypothetical protein
MLIQASIMVAHMGEPQVIGTMQMCRHIDVVMKNLRGAPLVLVAKSARWPRPLNLATPIISLTSKWAMTWCTPSLAKVWLSKFAAVARRPKLQFDLPSAGQNTSLWRGHH